MISQSNGNEMRLNILSGGAAQSVVNALAGDFRAATGYELEGTFGAVGAMTEKLLAGAPADLLILSGQAGQEGSWLDTILSAWDVSLGGEEDQLVQKDAYTLHIQRPAYRDEEAQHGGLPPRPTELAALDEMPVFARPLPTAGSLNRAVFPNRLAPGRASPIPVTQLVFPNQIEHMLSEEGEEVPAEEAQLLIRPAIRQGRAPSGRVPAYLAGRVIHRALADWACLELPEAELAGHLESYARREGIHTPQAVAATLRRCGPILEDLRASELYAHINSATRRYTEIPFSLTAWPGTPHGVRGGIDLLYEDRRGGWHLVDWKSEYVPRAQMQAHAEQHALQVAVYALAASSIAVFRNRLGQMPEAGVCFLTAGARLWTYSPQDLARVLDQLAAV